MCITSNSECKLRADASSAMSSKIVRFDLSVDAVKAERAADFASAASRFTVASTSFVSSTCIVSSSECTPRAVTRPSSAVTHRPMSSPISAILPVTVPVNVTSSFFSEVTVFCKSVTFLEFSFSAFAAVSLVSSLAFFTLAFKVSKSFREAAHLASHSLDLRRESSSAFFVSTSVRDVAHLASHSLVVRFESPSAVLSSASSALSRESSKAARFAVSTFARSAAASAAFRAATSVSPRFNSADALRTFFTASFKRAACSPSSFAVSRRCWLIVSCKVCFSLPASSNFSKSSLCELSKLPISSLNASRCLSTVRNSSCAVRVAEAASELAFSRAASRSFVSVATAIACSSSRVFVRCSTSTANSLSIVVCVVAKPETTTAVSSLAVRKDCFSEDASRESVCDVHVTLSTSSSKSFAL